MLVLSEWRNGALSANGNGRLDVTGGDIVVNSASRAAAKTNGDGVVLVSAPGQTRVTGQSTGGGFNPSAIHGADPVDDPLADFEMPDTGSMPSRSSSGGVLQPGVYNGPVDIHDRDVVLEPGLYVLREGLTLSGDGSLTGTGVTIINTVGSGGDGDASCGLIRFSGEATFSLSAPTDGDYAGLLIYQDPSCDVALTVAGGASGAAIGTVHISGGAIEVGDQAELGGVQLIADRIKTSGAASIQLVFDRNSVAGR